MKEMESIDDLGERRNAGMNFIIKNMNKKYPDIKRFPSHFYEDGIDSLIMQLRNCQNIALERFNGNEDITPFDTFSKLMNSIQKNDNFH